MNIPANSGGPNRIKTIIRVFSEAIGGIVSDINTDRVPTVIRVADGAILRKSVLNPVYQRHIMLARGSIR